MRLIELPDRTATRATAGGADLLLYRTGDRILAVSNRCTHQGAPLHRGMLRLPVYEARVNGDMVEFVRRPEAGTIRP